MYPLILSGVHPGTGAITRPTGAHGNHFSGTITMDITITGITIIMGITGAGPITALMDGTIIITEADSGQDPFLLKTGTAGVDIKIPIPGLTSQSRDPQYLEEISPKPLLQIISCLLLIKPADLL